MAFPLTFLNSQVAQCQPAALQWAGGLPPYAVAALDARFGGVGGALIAQVVTGAQSPFFQWDKAALPAGALVVFQVQDSTGKTAQTLPVAVGDSDDTSCLPASLQPAPTAVFTTIESSSPLASGSNAASTATLSTSPSQSPSGSTPHSAPNTGLILAIVGCSIVTLAIVSALWYWHLSRRKTEFLVSRGALPPALGSRSETPMWGNTNATHSDLKLPEGSDMERGAHAIERRFYPQSIAPLEQPISQPPRQPRLANIDTGKASAQSYAASPPLYSPPPPGGLTPMPPPRAATRGARSGSVGRRSSRAFQ